MAWAKEPCDPSGLDLFLRNRLPAEFQAPLETHLGSCPACRRRLDELAGGENWWDQVRCYLGDSSPANPPTADDATVAREPIDIRFLEPSTQPGTLGRLGDYEVLEVLGRGGMGIVLKAFDPALHRPVAIKVLAPEFAANGTARKRFAREAQAAAGITHDHVVSVFAVDANAPAPYLVMAFIPGQSLQERIDRSGPLELKEILRIGMQTAAGLAAAHAQGIVHRDIKPANIMLENGIERVRITDFGLARAVHDARVTVSGAVTGTPQYMAPEQARGDVVDQRADLFSLGSTMYAMCTGCPPFRGDSPLAIVRQVCDAEPAPIRSINPDIPVWLDAIIRKLQAKDPEDRLASASETALLFERCLAHVHEADHCPLPGVAVELGKRLRASGERPVKKRKRQRWLAGATVAAAIVLAWLGGRASDPRVVPSGSDDALASRQRKLLATGLDRDVEGETNRVRSKLADLRQRLTEPPIEIGHDGLDPAQRVAQWAAGMHREMTSSAPSDDPIVLELASLRSRVAELRRRFADGP